MNNPITLRSVYVPRVWGGRSLERAYGRELPGDDSMPVGESWDVVDRPEAQSLVTGGRHDGRTLNELWLERREEIFGLDAPDGERFPLLCKILDVRENLSIQVHPTPRAAAKLGGEPKSEYWYAARVEQGAMWYSGLRPGTTREVFERHLEAGTTPECLNRQAVKAGDSLWVPSGQVHALGAGQMVFEIQQNSDTTYRVFDWERPGSGGAGRVLHIEEAMQCIDFAEAGGRAAGNGEFAVDRREFCTRKICLAERDGVEMRAGVFSVMAVVSGAVVCGDFGFREGDYFLIPANAERCMGLVATMPGTVLLQTTWSKTGIAER